MSNYNSSPEVEEMLSKKFEGKLFVDISLCKIFGKSYSIIKDFYTVINGKVCCVNDGHQHFTDDTLLNVSKDCKQIGIYDPTKVYKRIIKDYNYSQFKKLHKL